MSERADLAELEELRQENADLTEKINQLEVCVGQLLKEIKFMGKMLKAYAGNNAAS